MVTGYGPSKSWIQEYEYLLRRQLKKFTIVDKKTVDNFRVCKSNCSVIPLAFLSILLSIQTNEIGHEHYDGILKQAYDGFNVEEAQEEMLKTLIDMFPGIQQCVNADLSVMSNCTEDGSYFIWL